MPSGEVRGYVKVFCNCVLVESWFPIELLLDIICLISMYDNCYDYYLLYTIHVK
jgi:hypothetical protein